MTDEPEEWSEWIEHNGKSSLPAGTIFNGVDARGCNDVRIAEPIVEGCADCFIWATLPSDLWSCRILRYRVRKPRGLIILEELIADLPEEVEA